MLDPRHLRLLLNCDRYVERQHVLLERLAAGGGDELLLAAMESAFDQLLQAVTVGWQALSDELDDDPADPDRVDHGGRRPGRTDTGGHPGGGIG